MIALVRRAVYMARLEKTVRKLNLRLFNVNKSEKRFRSVYRSKLQLISRSL